MYEKKPPLAWSKLCPIPKEKTWRYSLLAAQASLYYPYSSSLIAIQEDQLSGRMRIIIAWIGGANVFLTTVFLSSFARYDCFNAKQNKYK